MRRTLLKKGIRELRQSKFQYIFLILTIGLGIASYNSFNNMTDSRWSSFDEIYETNLFMDYEAELEYGVVVNENDAMAVLNHSGIADKTDAIEARLIYDVFLNHTSPDGVRISRGIVIGYNAFTPDGTPRWPDVNKPLFYEDSPAQFSAPNAKECYIEHAFAKYYGLNSGDTITIMRGQTQVQLEILDHVNVPEYISVVEEGSLLPSDRSLGILMMPIDTARLIFFDGASEAPVVNDVVIRLADPDADSDIGSDLEKAFEDEGIPVKVTDKESNPARKFLKDDIQGDSGMIAIFPGVIFTISAFGLFMALRRMIQTHRSQIGVFKALGVPDRVTVQYFATIGLFVGIFGVIAGLLLTYPLDLFFYNMMIRMLDLAVVDYNSSYEYFVYSAVAGVVLCVGCAILPAVSATRMKPIDAIQTREGVTRQKRNALLSKLDETHHLPVPVKLTVRNIFRKPLRTLSSILGVALSLTLFLSMIILWDTMVVIVDEGSEANLWDYEVVADGFMPVNVTSAWSDSIGGISGYYPGIRLPTMMSRGSASEAALVYALTDVGASYKVEMASGVMRQGEIVISNYLSHRLNADLGDIIQIDVPRFIGQMMFEMTQINVTVSGIQSNHIGYVVFMDYQTMAGLCNMTGLMNVVYLNTTSGERSTQLENAFMMSPGVSSATHVSERANLIAQYLDMFMEIIYLIAAVSTVLAMAIVYNLFMISAGEQRREYATMKTLGTSLRRIGYLLFFEAAYIALMGIALGAAGGYLLAQYMVTSASEFEVLGIELMFSWGGLMAGALMILGVVALVSYLTLRYIAGINMANVIRERSY